MSNIKRYRPIGHAPLVEDVNGGCVLLSDHEQAVKAAVAQERERCRREEVGPLTKVIGAVQADLHRAAARGQFDDADALDVTTKTREQITKAIATVEAIQKGQP